VDDRYTLLLWGVVFFSFAVIVCIVRARREKDEDYYKGFYLGAGAALLMLLFVVSAILQQPLLAWLFLCSGGALAIVGMPTTDKFLGRQIAEHLQGVDISAPLRGRDLLTQTGLLKTAYRWGVWKALFLFWLLMAAAIVGVLSILGLWFGWIRFGWISIDSILGYTFSSTIPVTVIYYRAISKALKSIEKSKESEN
jgi:hypothetical protein